MKYAEYPKEKLIEKIQALEKQNELLLAEISQVDGLQFSWVGNLGRWFWDCKSNKVMFNPLKVLALGYELREIPETVGFEFFTEKLHPDDYENVMQAMRDHLSGKSEVYEVEYRIKAKDHSYKWYYDRGKVTNRDLSGKPLFLAGIVFDITEQKQMEIDLEKKNQILAELSATDSLTGLKNHRTLYDQLESLINQSKKQPISLAMFDLDDFKQVNDTYGHIHGDKVLKEVAGIILNETRKTDICGRYGGEEFMIIFPNTGLTDAYALSENIRKNVQKAFQTNSVQVTLSGGCCEWNTETIPELIHQADLKLYEAKQAGKNQIRL